MPRVMTVFVAVGLCTVAASAWAEPAPPTNAVDESEQDAGDRSPAAPNSDAGSDDDTEDAASRDRQARQLYLDGDALYAAGRYEEAAENFRRAYELSQRPELLFNLGNALERLGQHGRAAEYLRRYLASPKARDAASVRERVRRLEERARRTSGLAPDAPSGSRPVATPGDRADPAPGSLKTSGDSSIGPVTREARAVTPLAPQRPGANAADRRGSGQVEPGASDRASVSSRRPAYIAFAVSGAAFAGALVSGLASRSAARDAEADCTAGEQPLCLTQAGDALDRERRFAIIADTSAVVGLATAGVGVYLLLRSRGRDSDALSPATPDPGGLAELEPVMIPGGVMMRWSHAF